MQTRYAMSSFCAHTISPDSFFFLHPNLIGVLIHVRGCEFALLFLKASTTSVCGQTTISKI